MKKIILLIGLLVMSMMLLIGCNNEEQDGGEADQVMEQIAPEELADTFLKGDFDRVYSQTSEAFQKEVSLKQLQELGKEFNEDVSAYILQSELKIGQEAKQYAWVDEQESKGIVAIFDESDVIHGLQIMPLTKYPQTDNTYTKTVFDFPFDDKWFVFWGGTNSLVNYHYEYENQRYAYDFVMMDDHHRTYDGDDSLNESYYAFGQEYLAPADGTVVKVENNVRDNEPVGTMNENEPLGNYVIIDHGHDEFSYLAHFKYESIEVQEGDEVKQGEVLGLVGNSGNSSEPHIHFHVADSIDPMTSKSIRMTWNREEAFKQGDIVG